MININPSYSFILTPDEEFLNKFEDKNNYYNKKRKNNNNKNKTKEEVEKEKDESEEDTINRIN